MPGWHPKVLWEERRKERQQALCCWDTEKGPGGAAPTPELPRPTASASPEPEFPVWETYYITSESRPRPKQTHWADWEGLGEQNQARLVVGVRLKFPV